jgi:hypothetical protein
VACCPLGQVIYHAMAAVVRDAAVLGNIAYGLFEQFKVVAKPTPNIQELGRQRIQAGTLCHRN